MGQQHQLLFKCQRRWYSRKGNQQQNQHVWVIRYNNNFLVLLLWRKKKFIRNENHKFMCLFFPGYISLLRIHYLTCFVYSYVQCSYLFHVDFKVLPYYFSIGFLVFLNVRCRSGGSIHYAEKGVIEVRIDGRVCILHNIFASVRVYMVLVVYIHGSCWKLATSHIFHFAWPFVQLNQ